jgi:hypothetical protein
MENKGKNEALEQIKRELTLFDYYYKMSDDHRTFTQGETVKTMIGDLISKQSDEVKDEIGKFVDKEIFPIKGEFCHWVYNALWRKIPETKEPKSIEEALDGSFWR